MAPSVSFSDDIVSDVIYIPRLSKESVPEYFYSRSDIDRFQRIWKQVYIQRIRQLEKARKAGEDTTVKTSPCSKRKRSNEDETGVTVLPAKRRPEVTRSVSPETTPTTDPVKAH